MWRRLDFRLGAFFPALEIAGSAEAFYLFVILFTHKVSLLCELDSVAYHYEDSTRSIQHLFVDLAGVGVGKLGMPDRSHPIKGSEKGIQRHQPAPRGQSRWDGQEHYRASGTANALLDQCQ